MIYHLFRRTHFCQSGIFLRNKFQKISNFGREGQSFHFYKITGTLKSIFCFENLQKPSLYIKEQSPKKSLKLKFVLCSRNAGEAFIVNLPVVQYVLYTAL